MMENQIESQFDNKLRIDAITEKYALGIMLTDADLAYHGVRLLTPQSFGLNRHSIIFEAIASVCNSGAKYDAYAVIACLDKQDLLGRIGGEEEIEGICTETPVGDVSYLDGLLRTLNNHAIERSFINAGKIIPSIIQDDELTFDEKVNKAESAIFHIADKAGSERDLKGQVQDALEYLETRFKSDVEYELPTGFSDLDEMTVGLHRGELTILGGIPSIGKSCIAHDIIRYTAIECGKPVIIFDYEHTPEGLLMRMASAISGVQFRHMRAGNYPGGDKDYDAVVNAISILLSAPITIVEGNPNILSLVSRVRHAKYKEPELALVVTDHVQLVQGSSPNMEIRVRVTEITAMLKEMAKREQVAILALSQMTRAARYGVPTVHQLRESGSLEQDADTVFLLYQEEDQPEALRLLKVAKQRNGPTGLIPSLDFDKFHLTFRRDYEKSE